MSQLSKLRLLVGDQESDDILNYYLDCASEAICNIRNSSAVESKYLNAQIKIAMELYSKYGAEGQTGHSELNISRSYESADISPSLLASITPVVTTPFSMIRVIQ